MADRCTLPFLLAAVCLLVLVTAGWAQTTTGNIRGEVKNPEGEPLPGVTVTVTGERGAERQVMTGPMGGYLLGSLAPGLYSMQAELEGMAVQSVDAVRVAIAGTATVNFILGAELITEQLTVTAETPLLDLGTSKVSTNYDAEFIEDLPTRREFWDMVAVSPGVSGASEWSNDLSAFGSGVRSNSWNIDGLNITHPEGGRAWWYINPETIAEVQVLGIGASAEYGNMTGAAINVVTKSGGNAYRGNFNAYYQSDGLTDTNVELEDSEYPTYVRDKYHNVTATLGGPMKRDKAWFFAALETNRDSESEPGVDPDYPAEYNWDRYDLKLDFAPSDSTRVDAKLHHEDYEDVDSGSAYIAPSARGHGIYSNPAWGAGVTHVISDRSLVEVSYAGWTSDTDIDSLTGSTEPAYADYAPPGGGPTLWWGGYLFPYTWKTDIHQVDAKMSHFADDFLQGEHDFRFGIGYSQASTETMIKPSSGGPWYYHDTYEYDWYGTTYTYDYYYKYTFTPHYYGNDQDSWSLFVDDSWRIGDRLTVNLGLRYDQHNGWIPSYERLDDNANGTGELLPEVDNVIDWSMISPRLGFAWVATGDMKTVVRGSVGIYYEGNIGGNWNYPPPELPSIESYWGYSWETAGENLYWTWDFPTALNVDPDLNPPRSDQFTLGVERQFGNTWAAGAMFVYKDIQDLIGWEILGDGVYEQVPYTDPFTGEQYTLLSICGEDEGCVTPTIRKGNRPGTGSIAPDEEYWQEYRAVVLTFQRRYSKGWSLMGSYTWSRSEGLLPRPQSQSQGTVLYGNLSDADPNRSLNAEQRLQNDRPHMLRMQGNFSLPYKFEATAAMNWQSGRPYARTDSVRLGQGRESIIIEPASNDRRHPTSLMLDVGIGKRWALSDRVELKTDLQVLNLLNDDASTYWETLWVEADEEYVASDWLWPRRLMIRIGLEF